MSEILALLIPVFAITGLGRVAVIRGLIDGPSVKALNDFALWIALPALLFRSLAESAALQVLDVGGVYLAGCLIVYVGAALIARVLLRCGLGDAALFGLNATYGSIIYLGTPIVAAAFGPPGVALLLAIIALHSGFLLPLTSIIIDLSGPKPSGLGPLIAATLRGLARNPILLSIALGVLWHTLALPIPAFFGTMLKMLGAAASPLALFCVGASLPMIGRDAVTAEAVLPILLKLFVLPPVVGLLAYTAGLSGLALTVMVIAAAMPTGANAFLLSRRTAGFVQASASTVVVTMVGSIATLSSLLLWLH